MQRRDANPTIRDIASALNLSHTTVSRVVNGKPDRFISETTRERVLQAVREMNYRPNHAARALATGRTNMIALWVGDVFDPYFAVVSHYTEAVLRRHNRDMVHVASNRSQQENSLNYAVDGILSIGVVEEIELFQKQAAGPIPPIVSMGGYVHRGIDFVEVDLAPATREAVHHLCDAGCKRVAYFVSEFGMQPDDVRRVAYDAAILERGRTPEHIVMQGHDRAGARAAIKSYVEANGCPDGLFCFNDSLAIGAYRGLRDLGRRIPEDVLLIGCDGIEDTEYFDTPISTIVQPYAEMCEKGWEMLERRMTDPAAPFGQETLRAQLFLRESALR